MPNDTLQPKVTPKGTERTESYVGRRNLRNQLRSYSQRILHEPICMIFYLQGRGGLGKTRFLQDYVALADVANSVIRVARVIDLADSAKRKLVVLEQKLIEGLKVGVSEQGIPADEVSEAFRGYFRALEVFQRSLQFDEQRRDAAEDVRIETFIAGWNSLSIRYPLVMRFDTLERLFIDGVSPEALPRRREARSGMEVILKWLLHVLPQLQHTLVLLSGRPPAQIADDASPAVQLASNPLAQQLQEHGLLESEGFQILQPLLDPGDIVQYLQNYGIDPEGRIAYIQQITEGRPLLLSLYAECQRPDPPTLLDAPLDKITTRLQFEHYLIDTILNPLHYVMPEGEQSDMHDRARAHQKLVLTFCLCILSYARRGLHADELADLLRSIDSQFVMTDHLLSELKREVLVKTVSQWGDNGEDGERLFLHDEIWQLIDESGLPRNLGLEELVLNQLCQLSQERVAQISQIDDSLGLLGAMADHVTYELTREFGRGYRFYLVYLDRLLEQRNDEEALVLADLFWRLLKLTVVRPSGPVRLYHDLLAEARTLNYATIVWHDRLHYIKLLRAQGTYQKAEAEAAACYQALLAAGVVPPLDALWPTPPADLTEPWIYSSNIDATTLLAAVPAPQPRVPHLFADLLLIWANVLLWAGASGDYEQQVVRQHCDLVIALLDNPTTLDHILRQTRALEPTMARDDNLVRLRRSYLLAQAYRIRGQLFQQRQDYDHAIEDSSTAIRSFQTYEAEPISLEGNQLTVVPAVELNDHIRDDVVFIQYNLALTFAENGNFGWALRISDALILDFAPTAQPYLQTLIYNSRALIHLRQGDYQRAEQMLARAEAAVRQTNIERAIGLVSWTKARIECWRMSYVEHRPQPEIEPLYERAAQRLAEERDSLRDIWQDQARFLRDLAFWYAEVGDQDAQKRYYKRALQLLEDAIELLPRPPQRALQHADLLETQISILSEMGHYSEAWELLNEIEPLMELPMPVYAQVVCGKLALQRAYLLLSDPLLRDEERALRHMAIGLARVYVFGMRHRDQASFERLILMWIGKLVPTERLAQFVNTIERDPFYIRLEDLPYQRPTLRKWTEAWDASVAFFGESLVQQQVYELLTRVEQELQQAAEMRDRTAMRAQVTRAEALAKQKIEECLQISRMPPSTLQELCQRAERHRRILDETE